MFINHTANVELLTILKKHSEEQNNSHIPSQYSDIQPRKDSIQHHITPFLQ